MELVFKSESGFCRSSEFSFFELLLEFSWFSVNFGGHSRGKSTPHIVHLARFPL